MGRLQRPLDPKAVEAADEKLYETHGSDPRPNALYDADGNQKPLDAGNPALQQEWKDQYSSALSEGDSAPERQLAGGPGAAKAAPAKARPPAFGPQPVGCATQKCAKTHWIKNANSGRTRR